MSTSNKLIDEVLSLPVEERALLADSLLKSLNKPDSSIDFLWFDVAKKRLEDFRAGRVVPVPGNEVFEKIKERFKK